MAGPITGMPPLVVLAAAPLRAPVPPASVALRAPRGGPAVDPRIPLHAPLLAEAPRIPPRAFALLTEAPRSPPRAFSQLRQGRRRGVSVRADAAGSTRPRPQNWRRATVDLAGAAIALYGDVMTEVPTVDGGDRPPETRAKDASNAGTIEPDDGPKGLPRVTFVLILASVVALFLLARGPVWRHPWSADALDSAIFWSYVPIPFLVALGLAVAKRFSIKFLLLESMVIVLLKYAITFSLALVFWALAGPPPAPAKPPPPPPKTAAPEAPPPPPTPIPEGQRGSVRGVVRDRDGKPVTGAFVYVASGLEAFVFERPKDPIHVENDGRSVRSSGAGGNLPPSLVVARAGQTILGRSLDGHLHTLVASGDSGGTTFNIPMMSSGQWSAVVVREPAKVSRLRCTVHPSGEDPAYLVVLDHPYFTATGEGGAFRIDGIPAAKISLAAFDPTSGEGAMTIEIAPRAEAAAELALAKPAPAPAPTTKP